MNANAVSGAASEQRPQSSTVRGDNDFRVLTADNARAGPATVRAAPVNSPDRGGVEEIVARRCGCVAHALDVAMRGSLASALTDTPGSVSTECAASALPHRQLDSELDSDWEYVSDGSMPSLETVVSDDEGDVLEGLMPSLETVASDDDWQESDDE